MPDREPNPEHVTPPNFTESDLLQLTIQIDNEPDSGEVHQIKNDINTLSAIFMLCSAIGWTEEKKEDFGVRLLRIETAIRVYKFMKTTQPGFHLHRDDPPPEEPII